MINMFDSYERIARVYPAIIISLPIIVTCYSISTIVNSTVFVEITSMGFVIVAVMTLLSGIVRYFGKKMEPRLWKSWGGAPTTRFLKQDNKKTAIEIKKLFYRKILADTNIDLLNNQSDEMIEQAVTWVRNILRNNGKKGLWRIFNIEYGFARNLLGSRSVWAIMSFGFSGICILLMQYIATDTFSLLISAIFNAVWGLCALLCGWFVLPALIKGIAERYAEDLIFSYLNYNK